MNAKMQKTARMIDAATTLFIAHGFEHTSMQKIADEAHVGVATLFRHFPKKELLIVAVIERIIGEMVPTFTAIREADISAFDKMARILDAYIAYLVEAKQAPAILLESFDYYAAYNKLEPALIAQIQQSYLQIGQLIKQTLRDGIDDGSMTLTEDELPEVMILFNMFGTAIKKYSFNRLSNIGIFPIPHKDELLHMKRHILHYIRRS